MPWRIGIDEAGYGPNLGPFVMTAAACRVPEALAQVSLWKTLRKLVRQARHQTDRRLLIDDSKKVYSGGKGLADLEVASLLALDCQLDCGAGFQPARTACLAEILPLFATPSHVDLRKECWFTGKTLLPLALEAASLPLFAAQWKELCAEQQIVWLRPCCEIVCTPRFNALIDRYGSKGAVLGLAFVQLIQTMVEQAKDEAIHVTVDKHGGRNYYQPLLQHAFPDAWVLPREEGMRQSVYEVQGLGRPVTVTFRVEGDANEMTVALASMISKYMREALMGEWNDYWRKEVPGLEATAGYPGDARRFYDEILPVVKRMKLAEDQVWRKR